MYKIKDFSQGADFHDRGSQSNGLAKAVSFSAGAAAGRSVAQGMGQTGTARMNP